MEGCIVMHWDMSHWIPSYLVIIIRYYMYIIIILVFYFMYMQGYIKAHLYLSNESLCRIFGIEHRVWLWDGKENC